MNNSKIQIEKISYKDILKLWKLLWPNTTDIQPMSSIQYLGGYDIEIYKKYQPTYIGLYNSKKLIGCISGHKSSSEYYRTRGIYILPDYRGQKLSNILFEQMFIESQNQNCNFIWSLPRKSALYSYTSKGFIQTTKFIKINKDYDSNCFVLKKIENK